MYIDADGRLEAREHNLQAQKYKMEELRANGTKILSATINAQLTNK
jgi:hypothetical protein